MNRSFSKIRHIQEANQGLEKRFLTEGPFDKEMEDDITSFDSGEFEFDDEIDEPEDESFVIPNEDDMVSDDDYQDLGLDYDDEEMSGGDEYEDLDRRKYREISMKKFKPQDLYGQAKRWSQGDDKYEPYNPIKPSDMNLDDYLKSKKSKLGENKKKSVRITESELVNLIKKAVKEQYNWDEKTGYHRDAKGCPQKKSSEELMKHMNETAGDNYFYCFPIPEAFKQRMMSERDGAFKYNKQANVLEIYKVKGPYLFFGGPYFGDKLGNIKMPKNFPSKFPTDFNEENGDFPYWEIVENNVCLYIGGFC